MARENPQILNADELMQCYRRFDAILDVRTPDEYENDHIPGAINTPVLSRIEHAEVGTLHKADPFAARRLGAAHASRRIANTLEEFLSSKGRDWRPLIYCWRGGNRSGAMAHVLAKVGWQVTLLSGGYKAYRREVAACLPGLAAQFQFRVVCGLTGVGKTHLLRALAAQGQQVLDLEGLANHRGSILGASPEGPQPSQKRFESLLWDAMVQLDPHRPVFVESESRKVGNVQVPEALISSMRRSPCIELLASEGLRVELLCGDYRHFQDNTQPLVAQLRKLEALVGASRVNEWVALVEQQDWSNFVSNILRTHYDPSYSKSMARNFSLWENRDQFTLGGSGSEHFDVVATDVARHIKGLPARA